MEATHDLLLSLLSSSQGASEGRATRHSQPHGLSGDEMRQLLRAAAEEADAELRRQPERELAAASRG
jgi:hypothetical protein